MHVVVVDLPGVKDQRDALDAVDVAGIVTLRPVVACTAPPSEDGSTTTVPGATVPGSTPSTGSVPSDSAATTAGPAYQAARVALRSAWGSDPVDMATGGAIPLASALHAAAPNAEILFFGPQDGLCNLHAPNERVLLGELVPAAHDVAGQIFGNDKLTTEEIAIRSFVPRGDHRGFLIS